MDQCLPMFPLEIYSIVSDLFATLFFFFLGGGGNVPDFKYCNWL